MTFVPGLSSWLMPAAVLQAAADAAFGRQAGTCARQGGNGHGETG
jgi:hypothetical protein